MNHWVFMLCPRNIEISWIGRYFDYKSNEEPWYPPEGKVRSFRHFDVLLAFAGF